VEKRKYPWVISLGKKEIVLRRLESILICSCLPSHTQVYASLEAAFQLKPDIKMEWREKTSQKLKDLCGTPLRFIDDYDPSK
jgi:hypothetical protein